MMHLRVWLKQDYNMYVKQQGRLGDIVSYFAVATKEYKATPLFDQNKWRQCRIRPCIIILRSSIISTYCAQVRTIEAAFVTYKEGHRHLFLNFVDPLDPTVCSQ
jgi:hypothetical protein